MKQGHIGEAFKEELDEAKGGLRKARIIVSHAQSKRMTYAKRIRLFADATGWLTIACTIIAVLIIAIGESPSSYATGYNIGTLIGSCFVLLLLTSVTGLLADISVSLTEQAGRQKADSQ